jgi:hypothetical protein
LGNQSGLDGRRFEILGLDQRGEHDLGEAHAGEARGRRRRRRYGFRISGAFLSRTGRRWFCWFLFVCQDCRYRSLKGGHVGSQLVRLLVQPAQVVE